MYSSSTAPALSTTAPCCGNMKKAPLGVLFLLTKSAVSILPPVSGGQPMAVPTMSAIGIVPAVRAHHRAYRPNLMPLGIVRQDGKSSGMVSCTGQKHLVCTAQTEPGLALRAARQGVKGLTPATFGSFPSPGKELLGLGGRSHTGIDHCHKDVIRKVKMHQHGRFVNRPYNVRHKHRANLQQRTADGRPYKGTPRIRRNGVGTRSLCPRGYARPHVRSAIGIVPAARIHPIFHSVSFCPFIKDYIRGEPI